MVNSFPDQNILITQAFKIFDITSESILKDVAPVLFLIRIAIIKLTLSYKSKYGELLKDTMFLFVGILCFKELMGYILEMPGYAKSVVEEMGPLEIDLTKYEDNKWYSFSHVKFFFGFDLTDMELGLGYILKYIGLIAYWLMYWIYTGFIFITISVGSIIILFGTMFNLRWLLSTFLLLVVIASLWPFIWYATDFILVFASKELISNGSYLGVLISSIVTNFLKIMIPAGFFLWGMKDPVRLATAVGNNTLGGIKTSVDFFTKPYSVASNTLKGNYVSALNQMGVNKQNGYMLEAKNDWKNGSSIKNLNNVYKHNYNNHKNENIKSSSNHNLQSLNNKRNESIHYSKNIQTSNSTNNNSINNNSPFKTITNNTQKEIKSNNTKAYSKDNSIAKNDKFIERRTIKVKMSNPLIQNVDSEI